MELKDFISQTLTEIATGVKAAQSSTIDMIINPKYQPYHRDTNRAAGYSVGDTGTQIFAVDFDVAVEASEAKGGKASIAVFGGLFGAGAGLNKEEQNKFQNRIRFSVPVILPQPKNA